MPTAARNVKKLQARFSIKKNNSELKHYQTAAEANGI